MNASREGQTGARIQDRGGRPTKERERREEEWGDGEGRGGRQRSKKDLEGGEN